MGTEVAWGTVPGMALQQEVGTGREDMEQVWVQGLEQGDMAASGEGRMEGVRPMAEERRGGQLAMDDIIHMDGLRCAPFPSCYALNLRVHACGSWSGLF